MHQYVLPAQDTSTSVSTTVPVGQSDSVVAQRVQIGREEAGVAVEVQGLPAEAEQIQQGLAQFEGANLS